MSERSVSAGARLRAAVEAERPLQVVGTINAYAALLAQTRRLSRDLPVRCRRGQCLLRPARPRHHLAERRVRGRAAHLRRLRAAAAGGCRHRLRAAPSTSRAPASSSAAPAPPACTWRTRCRPSAAGTGRARRWCRRRRWWTASRPRSMRAAIRSSSSWRAPMRTRSRGRAPRWSARAAYVAAGADMIFAEALRRLDEYRQFAAAVRVPVLANITEFGQTPLFSAAELGARRRAPGAVSTVGVPRRRQGAGAGVRGHPPRRHAEGRGAVHADPRGALRRCSAITPTKRSSIKLFGKNTDG